MKKAIYLIILLAVIACSGQQGKTSGPVVIAAVNYPVAFFAEKIGGALVKVELPIPAGVDPAYWTPDEAALQLYQEADIILANGAGYAKWMEKASLPESKIIYTADRLNDRYLTVNETTTHSHGSEGEHEHMGFAFTTWLDFEIATAQAKAVYEALLGTMPQHKEELNVRFKQLKIELESFDRKLIEYSKSIRGKAFVASHPVYQYFGQRYHLEIYNLHWEPDKIPSQHEWENLISILKEHQTGTMLWEAEPLPKIRQELEKINLNLVVFDPCSNKPETGDFMSVMRENVASLLESGIPR